MLKVILAFENGTRDVKDFYVQIIYKNLSKHLVFKFCLITCKWKLTCNNK